MLDLHKGARPDEKFHLQAGAPVATVKRKWWGLGLVKIVNRQPGHAGERERRHHPAWYGGDVCEVLGSRPVWMALGRWFSGESHDLCGPFRKRLNNIRKRRRQHNI